MSEICITDKRICLRRLYLFIMLAIEERLQAQREKYHSKRRMKTRMVKDKLCNSYVGVRLRDL